MMKEEGERDRKREGGINKENVRAKRNEEEK